MDNLDLIAVGEIVKAQGLRGEVKVVPLTDNLKRFNEIKRVYFNTAAGYRELEIESYRLMNQSVLLKFRTIDDLTMADALGRGLIFIPRQERPSLPAGRYYLDELQGLHVFDVIGEFLGIIEQVLVTGSNDVYIVRNKQREILIPALRSVVKSINISEKKMVVELPPGLVEERE